MVQALSSIELWQALLRPIKGVQTQGNWRIRKWHCGNGRLRFFLVAIKLGKQVVVIGGGFGGLAVTRALAREAVQVTLVDRRNHHLFQPLLYQVAMAGLSPAEIAVPIGRSRAVAEIGKIRLSGFIAWLTWLLVHIYYLVDFRNRTFVIIQWAWSYLTYRRGARLITGRDSQRG